MVFIKNCNKMYFLITIQYLKIDVWSHFMKKSTYKHVISKALFKKYNVKNIIKLLIFK